MNKQTTEFSTHTFLECPLFSFCGGCVLQKDFHSPPSYFEIKKFFESKGVSFSLQSEKLLHWRKRAKLAIRGSSLHPEIGLFKKHSHEVLSIPNCPMHDPIINDAVKVLRACIESHKIDPYKEDLGAGDLRYAQFVIGEAGKVQLTLVINAKEEEVLKNARTIAFFKDLSKNDLWHSVWINCNNKKTNTIFGEAWILYFGEKFLRQKLGNRDLYLHPASFSQAHFSLFEKLVFSIVEKIKPSKKVLELYAGVGGIGFSVLEKSSSVFCTEINPYAKECFEKTKNTLTNTEKEKIFFETLSAEDSICLLRDCEVLIVDPPRKGVDKKVLDAISHAKNLEQIVYVSCQFSSLVKDLEIIKNFGWNVSFAEGYLLFPGTDQVEVLCILEKSG